MLVSAISKNFGTGNKINLQNLSGDNTNNDTVRDTAFNSLTPGKKTISADKMPQVFYNINEWQKFCHKQILGNNLNVIA